MFIADIRINARLSGADAQRYQELIERSGLSASDLLREALREYHAAHAAPRRNAAQLLANFAGSGEGPEDLSIAYKRYLTDALEEKIPMRIQESSKASPYRP